MNAYEEALQQLSGHDIALAEQLLKLQEQVLKQSENLLRLTKLYLELRLEVNKLNEEVK